MDDFADLDAAIATAMEAKAERTHLNEKKKRLAVLERKGTPDAMIEHQLLLAAVRRLEEGIVWRTVGMAVLFHSQTCGTCGHRHRFFMGVMTEQHHVTDKTAMRLIRERPEQNLPTRVVEHDLGTCEMCSDCVESCLIIQEALDHAKRPDPPQRPAPKEEQAGGSPQVPPGPEAVDPLR